MGEKKPTYNRDHSSWICFKELSECIHWVGPDKRKLSSLGYSSSDLLSWCLVFPRYWTSCEGTEVNRTAPPPLFVETWRNICSIIISLSIGKKLAWLKCVVLMKDGGREGHTFRYRRVHLPCQEVRTLHYKPFAGAMETFQHGHGITWLGYLLFLLGFGFWFFGLGILFFNFSLVFLSEVWRMDWIEGNFVGGRSIINYTT